MREGDGVMEREELAQLLYEIDQRIAYGHVRTPWADRPHGVVKQHARKRAEQLLFVAKVEAMK